MKRVFEFGKIDYFSRGRKTNLVTVEVELRTRDDGYYELSICGNIWNHIHSDIYCGGQCLDTIAEFKNQLSDPKLFDYLYELWQKYHLNTMHAGTPEQECAIERWKADGNKYDYKAACEMLKSHGLYEVEYTGPAVGRYYTKEQYRYGSAWLIQELPSTVVTRVSELIQGEPVNLKERIA